MTHNVEMPFCSLSAFYERRKWLLENLGDSQKDNDKPLTKDKRWKWSDDRTKDTLSVSFLDKNDALMFKLICG